MATLKSQIQARLAVETDELVRIEGDFNASKAAIQARIGALQQALLALTPENEAILDKLASVGIRFTV